MNKISNFSCFKNTKKSKENQPDYYLSAKIEDEYVNIGAGWIKSASDGSKFISFKLQETYNDRNGFYIKMEQPEPISKDDLAKIEAAKSKHNAAVSPEAAIGLYGIAKPDDMNANSIPF